jgi:glutamate mutase epsilon subunit
MAGGMTRLPSSARPRPRADLGDFVQSAARAGELVVQPRMGMARPEVMAAGLAAVAGLRERTVGTITLDSYTRVGDHAAATAAVGADRPLNGFPLVSHGPKVAAEVADAAGPDTPVQVRHGSADPRAIFRTMIAAGLSASEGGPVSYCLPYGRTSLADSTAAWREGVRLLADESRAAGVRAHLETFGGCLLGQLCPPSLLVTVSALEALFFVQNGITSVSLSYAQQTHPEQDAGALAALRLLADELLPTRVDRHLVLYTYMGLYPRTPAGAGLLLARSARLAVRGGAERLIVKTETEAHHIAGVEANLAALRAAAAQAAQARAEAAPPAAGPDTYEVLAEARALVTAVLSLSDDVGTALLRAFRRGMLDVPYCLHPDNRGATRSVIADDGRLRWADMGAMPLPAAAGRRAAAVSPQRLERMLRRTAQEHDREAAATAAVPLPVGAGDPDPVADPLRIAVVGIGPRGLAVLERLIARSVAESPDRRIDVFAIDPYPAGAGRVWRKEQSRWFLMNTPAREVTMFSGPRDGGPDRAGAGPSLSEWWAEHDPQTCEPDGYAPRVVYGAYLENVLKQVVASAGKAVRVHQVRARVLCVDRGPATRESGGYRLRLDRGDVLTADRLVLATGHPVNELSAEQRGLAAFADAHPRVRYISGDSAPDMALSRIPEGAVVGVLGMGLTFYDVVAGLTLERGGRFIQGEDGLLYVPSGAEPRIVPASRSGVPLLTRGVNQKSPDHSYRAALFTPELMAGVRARGPVDFHAVVLPWLMAEMNLVLLGTRIRLALGAEEEAEFRASAVQALPPHETPRVEVLSRLAAAYGVDPEPVYDLGRLARPFAGQRFASQAAFQKALAGWLREDLAQARLGNVDGPLKSACDVFRDVRQTIRSVVDFGGLTPNSHQRFLREFAPMAALVSTGPPALRSEQFLALMEAGVLDPVGPQARFRADQDTGWFTVSSDVVTDCQVRLDVLVDARVPGTDLRADRDPLIRGLLADGTIRTFVNSWAGHAYDTGGLASTDSPFHPIRADGTVEYGMHVIGIPSEHTRWFTQVGSGRPGTWGCFTRDADAIAAALLRPLGPAPDAPDAADAS